MFSRTDFDEFADCLSGLLDAPLVLQMQDITQHGHGISCYEHSLYVAYISYKIAKKAGRDFRTAARGAMLHDLYLANWSETDVGLFKRLWTHPTMALENAQAFNINAAESDIIVNHMWPLTPKMPKTTEGKIVSIADKICASSEMLGFPAPMFIAKRMSGYMREGVKAVS